MDNAIKINGISIEVWHNTPGSRDSYGDPAPNWAKVTDEVVWIQGALRVVSQMHGTATTHFISTMAGELDVSTYLGYLQSTTVIQEKDQLRIGSLKYDVVRVLDARFFGYLSHYEALLRRYEEGS